MKRVTATTREVFEVDEIDLLERIARGEGVDFFDFDEVSTEIVLVEIEDVGKETCQLAGKPAASHRGDDA